MHSGRWIRKVTRITNKGSRDGGSRIQVSEQEQAYRWNQGSGQEHDH